MKLSKKEHSALMRFKAAVEAALAGTLVEVRLFGSKARGEARKDSDIDVLVISSSDDWHVCDLIYDIATEILLESDVCISPKVLSEKQYKHLHMTGSGFIRNVIQDGITI
jgi:predicted nucleotidyltransferase